jgi:hypothetical protein
MQRPRIPCQLSESLHHRLNSYALAASAAGVGVLALAQPAEAKIVYTPANENLSTCDTVLLDLNHDGINDFLFQNFCARFTSALGLYTKDAGNKIWGTPDQKNGQVKLASALPANFRVRPGKHFSSGNRSGSYQGKLMWRFQLACSTGTQTNCKTLKTGQWLPPVTDRYLGLKFKIKGKTHYGWARVTVPLTGNTILTGYAYETIQNKPIITGKTHRNDEATLGGLAQGAFGLSNGGKP